MSGLLDLPVETIEQIYDAHENLLIHGDTCPRGQLRLVCRYIQQASRRQFRLAYFRNFVLRLNGEGIDRLCALSQTADLARSIKHLVVPTGDDGLWGVTALTNTQHGGSGLAEGESTIGSELQVLIPEALTNRRGLLLNALRACRGLIRLVFCPRIIEKTRTRHGRRGDDGFQSDISSSFDFILTILAQAGRRPSSILIFSACVNRDMDTCTGLTDAAGLVKGRQALRSLTHLDLTVTEHWRNDVRSPEDAGTRIGEQLCTSIGSLSKLKVLILKFNHTKMSASAWIAFSQGPAFPRLQRLELWDLIADLECFVHFTLKHRRSLRYVSFFAPELSHENHGSVDVFKHFLGRLRDFSHLESFNLDRLMVDDEYVQFPRATDPCSWDVDAASDPEDAEYVCVEVRNVISFKGAEKVKDGLALMLACMELDDD